MELIELVFPTLLYAAICMAIVETIDGFAKEFIKSENELLRILPKYLAYCLCVIFALIIFIPK